MRRTAWITVIAATLACSAANTSAPRGMPQKAATPVFSPVPGTYTEPQTVTISSATAGATVHCTQDGSTPTATSPVCADPITVSATTTLRAIATASGHLDSDVADGTYTIEQAQPKVATPVLSPPPDTYASSQTVTISCATAGATVHCTRDGSTPTAASPTCADPISVATTTTLRAIATASGYLDSDVAGGTYTIQADATPAATPTFSPDPATVYTSAVQVTITSATAGATVHCTTDGSSATAQSPTCSGPRSVSVTTTFHAVATAPGHTVSAQASATYTIQGTTPRAATPTFSPAAGTYTSSRTVTISSATSGATIHCTRDGSTATEASPTCADPIAVTSTTTLHAVATASGYTPSLEGTATYTLRVVTPTFSPAGGAYPSGQTVTISTTTAGATIHCTQNGATPTASSPVCAGPIQVATTTTLKAIATAPGWSNSAVSTATYTIGGSEPSDFDCALALSTSRQFWGHQSVGNYIMYVGNGLDAQLKALKAGVRLVRISSASGVTSLAAGDWSEWEIPDNDNPRLKLDNFKAVAQAGFPDHLDFAALKFCFVDIGESTDIDGASGLWAYYQSIMDPIEAAYPGRLIFWTVPLTPASPSSTDASNAKREALSNHIRTKYGPTGRVFDFADREAHDDLGNAVTDQAGVRTMWSGWAGSGGSDAHPNTTGTEKFAREYLHFMCNRKLAQ